MLAKIEMQMDVRMSQPSSLSASNEAETFRSDTKVASICTLLGLVAIVAAHGGIENMIAGSVGSVGAGCLAVGLTFLDRRLTYMHRVQAGIPIVLMLLVVGFAIKSNALALAGYPMLLLGLAGLLPAALRWQQASPTAAPISERSAPQHNATSPALSH